MVTTIRTVSGIGYGYRVDRLPDGWFRVVLRVDGERRSIDWSTYDGAVSCGESFASTWRAFRLAVQS